VITFHKAIRFLPAYLEHFKGRKLSRITEDSLSKFKKKLRATRKKRGKEEITDSSINRALAGLRRLFNFAVSRKYMVESPFPKTPKSGLFYPGQKGLRNFFTEEQMEWILDASPWVA